MTLLETLGLDKHDVKDLAGVFDIRHSPACRAMNVKNFPYRCICGFFEKICASAWRVFGRGERLVIENVKLLPPLPPEVRLAVLEDYRQQKLDLTKIGAWGPREEARLRDLEATP